MNNITTLENVFQRVDATFQTCHDSLIPVKDISFDNLDTIKIAGSAHPLSNSLCCLNKSTPADFIDGFLTEYAS